MPYEIIHMLVEYDVSKCQRFGLNYRIDSMSLKSDTTKMK